VHALEGVTIDVNPGEILAIVGGSGCGKSTLLRAISGLDTPTQGSVRLDDMTITKPHEQIGIIFQEPRLLPWLSVADNVGFGIEDRPKQERAERVADALDRVGLTDKAKVWPRELSGGQAQRVASARALVPRPQVPLLDEPFSALDAFTRVDLQDHLLNLWAEFKPTLILVTHDVEEEDLRPRHQRAHNRDALALAAGELARPHPCLVGQADALERPGHAGISFLLRTLLQAEADIIGDPQPRQQARLLEDDADLLVRLRDRQVIETNRALRRGIEAGYRAQQGRLAAAGAADHHHDLARRNVERDGIQRVHAVRIGFSNAFQAEHVNSRSPA